MYTKDPARNPFKDLSSEVNRYRYDQRTLFENQIEKPVTIEEAAQFLQKSPETIRRYCRLNWKGFPSVKIGRNYMLLLSSVTRWIKDLEKEHY